MKIYRGPKTTEHLNASHELVDAIDLTGPSGRWGPEERTHRVRFNITKDGPERQAVATAEFLPEEVAQLSTTMVQAALGQWRRADRQDADLKALSAFIGSNEGRRDVDAHVLLWAIKLMVRAALIPVDLREPYDAEISAYISKHNLHSGTAS